MNIKTPTQRYLQKYREKQRIALEASTISNKAEKDDPNPKKIMKMTLSEKLLKDGYRETVDKTKWISRNDFNGRVGIATTGKGFSYA